MTLEDRNSGSPPKKRAGLIKASSTKGRHAYPHYNNLFSLAQGSLLFCNPIHVEYHVARFISPFGKGSLEIQHRQWADISSAVTVVSHKSLCV